MTEAVKVKKPNRAFMPAEYSISEAYAVRAVAEGIATPEQQKKAMKWIIENASHACDLSYGYADKDDTNFAEGSRWVGLQLIKLINLNSKLLPLTEGN